MPRFLAAVLSLLAPATLLAQNAPDSASGGEKANPLPYFVAALFSIVVMVIVCKPSRKQ